MLDESIIIQFPVGVSVRRTRYSVASFVDRSYTAWALVIIAIPLLVYYEFDLLTEGGRIVGVTIPLQYGTNS